MNFSVYQTPWSKLSTWRTNLRFKAWVNQNFIFWTHTVWHGSALQCWLTIYFVSSLLIWIIYLDLGTLKTSLERLLTNERLVFSLVTNQRPGLVTKEESPKLRGPSAPVSGGVRGCQHSGLCLRCLGHSKSQYNLVTSAVHNTIVTWPRGS